MRALVVEDDLVSRKFLSKFLSQYGEVDVVVDGLEALDAYLLSYKDDQPYHLGTTRECSVFISHASWLCQRRTKRY